MTSVQRRSTAEWQSVLDQYESSSLSVAAFCAEQGVGTASFYQWRKRLSVSDFGEEPNETLPFVDVSALAAQASGEIVAPPWLIELELGNGLILRLNRG